MGASPDRATRIGGDTEMSDAAHALIILALAAVFAVAPWIILLADWAP